MKNDISTRRRLTRMTTGILAPLLPLLFSVTVLAVEPDHGPPDAEERFDQFQATLTGAATATRRRALENLRQSLEGELVVFSGSIYNLSEISLRPNGSSDPEWGVAFFSWEHDGLLLKHPPTDPDTPSTSPLDQLRFRLGNGDSATLVILQGDSLKLYGLTSDQDLIDQLRSGVELNVRVLATGLRGNTLFGFLVGLAEPEAELSCGHGHHFKVSTGFVFCPFCGRKLVESR